MIGEGGCDEYPSFSGDRPKALMEIGFRYILLPDEGELISDEVELCCGGIFPVTVGTAPCIPAEAKGTSPTSMAAARGSQPCRPRAKARPAASRGSRGRCSKTPRRCDRKKRSRSGGRQSSQRGRAMGAKSMLAGNDPLLFHFRQPALLITHQGILAKRFHFIRSQVHRLLLGPDGLLGFSVHELCPGERVENLR